MSIKLAFSSSAAAGWDWAELARRAALWGFQGVEVGVSDGEIVGHPLLVRAEEGRKILDGAGLAVAGIVTELALHERDAEEWAGVRETVKRAVEKAHGLGAGAVVVMGYQVPRGEDRMSCLTRVGRRLAELGALAAGSGVVILLRNGGGFVRAKDVWMVLEVAAGAVNEPQMNTDEHGCGGREKVGVCWDVAATAEGPGLSVPTLNSRIRYGMVSDRQGAEVAALGTGEVGLKNKGLVERLRGIGFEGWVSYSPAARAGAVVEKCAEEIGAAAKVLRTWLKWPELGPDGQPVPPPPKVEAVKAGAKVEAKPAEKVEAKSA